MALVSTLQDAFNGAELGPAWTTIGGGGTVEGGALTIPCTSSYRGIRSAATYGLVGSRVCCELSALPAVGDGTSTAFLSFRDAAGDNELLIGWSNAALNTMVKTAGVASYDGGPFERFVGLREDAGSVFFETSPDARPGSWTVRRTVPRPAWVESEQYVELRSGFYGTIASPGAARVESVNVAPLPAAASSAIGVEVGIPYVIVGPDGTRAVFNDSTDSDFVGFLNGEDGVTGLERAGIRESADLLPEADGGVHGAFRYDRLAFTLKGLIPPEAVLGGTWLSRQARLLRATNAMRGDSKLFWTPSEAPPVMVAFRQQQPTRITGRIPKNFLVTGVCERNVIESQEQRSVTLNPGAAASGGMRSPLASPVASSSSAAGSAIAQSAGFSEAWPQITITGPIVNPTVANQTVGYELRLNYTLGAGEQLVLNADPRKRSVRLANQANRYGALDYLASTWWPLMPGDNDLRMGAASFSAGASVLVAWRDAWG